LTNDAQEFCEFALVNLTVVLTNPNTQETVTLSDEIYLEANGNDESSVLVYNPDDSQILIKPKSTRTLAVMFRVPIDMQPDIAHLLQIDVNYYSLGVKYLHRRLIEGMMINSDVITTRIPAFDNEKEKLQS